MGIGLLELVVTAFVGVPVVVVAVLTRHRWVLGILGCFALAAAATPPDLVSMLLLAVPLSGIYTLAAVAWLLLRGRRPAPPAGGAAQS